jgi:hypothetical protein
MKDISGTRVQTTYLRCNDPDHKIENDVQGRKLLSTRYLFLKDTISIVLIISVIFTRRFYGENPVPTTVAYYLRCPKCDMKSWLVPVSSDDGTEFAS